MVTAPDWGYGSVPELAWPSDHARRQFVLGTVAGASLSACSLFFGNAEVWQFAGELFPFGSPICSFALMSCRSVMSKMRCLCLWCFFIYAEKLYLSYLMPFDVCLENEKKKPDRKSCLQGRTSVLLSKAAPRPASRVTAVSTSPAIPKVKQQQERIKSSGKGPQRVKKIKDFFLKAIGRWSILLLILREFVQT